LLVVICLRRKIVQIVFETRTELASQLNQLADEAGELR